MDNNTEIESIPIQRKKGTTSIIGFSFAIIPYLLFGFCFLMSGGNLSDNDSGAIWWLMIFYFMSVGFPFMVASIVFGLIGLKSEKRVFSYLALALTIVAGLSIIFFLSNN